MNNAPNVKLGIVAVSRDCFPAPLSKSRRIKVVEEYRKLHKDIYECPVMVENEKDASKALDDIKKNGIDALVIYLGNFGPEGPETMLAQKFGAPVMFCAAAEENDTDSLNDNRGDAFCGMLNASYNLGLRNVKAYIPAYPVGYPEEVALMIVRFETIARILIGIRNLKIFSFGPRPYNFLACNAPIKPLFDLGVEIQENSELDLYEAYVKHENDKRIPSVIESMNKELCGRNNHPTVMQRLAQFELTLLDWKDNNLEASEYAAFADKCWPAFQTMFKFVPCYVNSRMAAMGYTVACETDIYGALSEYILYLASESIPTLLDINNTVPRAMYEKHVRSKYPYTNEDIFMGFHCGNTSSCNLNAGCGTLDYQKIMKRLIEPDKEPDVSRGTLDGVLKPGNMTLFRLQSTADAKLRSYIARGEILDVDPNSFGSIGVIAIPEMARFYRHVLIEKQFPHHAGVSFDDVSSILFDTMRMLNVDDISFNRPAGMLYSTENPF